MNAGRKVFVDSRGVELAVVGVAGLGTPRVVVGWSDRAGGVRSDEALLAGGAKVAGFLRWVLVEVLGAAAEAGIEVPLDSALAARLHAGVDRANLELAPENATSVDGQGVEWVCAKAATVDREAEWSPIGAANFTTLFTSGLRRRGAVSIDGFVVAAEDLALLRDLAAFARADSELGRWQAYADRLRELAEDAGLNPDLHIERPGAGS